ncbi:5'-nucleotidase C-terminal domain-containing protein [Neobacillus sp. FSL H8-0543]|uniref:5'-nucleotidase C-terminal domain-containing protein n=1 Tax=Neobacillus sp. FSL H8-0543 TaxID=2954672 RepID=UPI003159898D
MRLLRKQLFVLTTIFTLLASYVLPYVSSASAAESNIITVAEALTTEAGNAVTVKGYIVGHTLGTNKYNFVAPFGSDTNMAIADSPNETDPAKIMPVELPSSPSSIRATYGLKTNPTNLGKEIVVTATVTPYFTVPGLKTPAEIYFFGEEPPVKPPFVGVEGLKIADIQGESHISPYKDQNVKGVEGIVTYVVDNSNFFMQSATPDDKSSTAEGVLVYKTSHGVTEGDRVAVNGLVKEWVLEGYAEKLETDLAMTEINALDGSVTKLDSGNSLPAPVVIDKDSIPTQVVDNDAFATFDPSEDGIDFYESLEGMRVALENPTAVGPQKYKEIPVIVGQVDGKLYTDAGGTILTDGNANPERMHILTDDSNFVAKTGDKFNGTVTGVVSYGFSNYKILTDAADLPELVEGTNQREELELEFNEDKLTVASYNVENFTALDAAKMNKIAKSMVNNLKNPDIIGLVEVQDNDGPKDSGTVEADANYTGLIEAIKANGGPTYAWTDIAPTDKVDGGQPGGNIRVGFLYNPERVILNEGQKGSATEAVKYVDGSLTLNPGRIDPANAAFNSSRKPLAAEFTFNGEEVIVIANHFNSKGGDQATFGKHQPPVLGSEEQRMEIAKIVNGFVTDVLTDNADANVVVLGDLNDFEFSNPINTLEGDILKNLVETVPATERYTYNYQGNAQVLDQILATNKLAAGAETDIVHLNSQFMEVHGRVSDHDAVVSQFSFDTVVEDQFNLSIMHVNDSHANVEKYPLLTTAVNQVRAEKPDALLVDAGDVFSGTLYFNRYEGLADLWFMNNLGYDAMTFGNHEFDKNSTVLANFIKEMQFPMVSANVNVTNDADLSPLFKNEISAAPVGGNIYPAIIKEVDGEQVGIFGLTTEDTKVLASPSEDVVFEDVVEEAEATVAALEAKGVNKIVILSHLGYGPDKELAAAVDGIDVIVGGHTHTTLSAPEVVGKAEPTVIVQANEYLNYLGVLDVTFDDNGVVVANAGKLIATKGITADEAAKAQVSVFAGPLDEYKQTLVGKTDVVLDGVKANVRTKETNLGNLITDGMLEKAKSIDPNTTIAMQNGGGIRTSIDQGDITLGEVTTVLPFGNLLVTLDLTGAEILEALEHGVSNVEAGDYGAFLHVAGLQYKYDVSKPKYDRVWEVNVKTADGSYAPIDLDATYTVATNAFTANGGDGYTGLKAAKDDGRINELLIVDFEIMAEYIEKHSPIAPTVEGRIVAEAEPFNLSIMHVNDSHANVEKYPLLTTAVNQVRAEKPDALLVDAGDVFSGTLYFNRYEGLADLWFMNNLGYDAMTFGNHEFDKNSTVLANFIKEMQFPMVSANVNVTNDADLSPLFKDEISAAPVGGNIYPAIIKEVDGEQVGIFGLTTEDTKVLASPSEDVVFENVVEEAEATVAALKAKGINKVVVLSHLGYGPDKELAAAVDGIDVIVGGHTHTMLSAPEVVEKAEPTVIVQANEYLNYLGVLDVTFDDYGVVVANAGELIATKGLAADEAAKAQVSVFAGPLDEYKQTVVGSTDVVLDGVKANVRSKETNLGNLITDGMLEKAKSLDPNTTIAMQNGGGIRTSIDQGNITLGEVTTVLPFGNLLVTLDLTGAEILEALEHGVSNVEAGDYGAFLHVAGLQYKYDVSKPKYDRVWEVNVKTADGSYAPIDLDATYTVATNAFTANGGDGYTGLKAAKDDGRINELLIVDFEIMAEYIEKHSPVAPTVEGRIIAEKETVIEPIQTGWVLTDDGKWFFFGEDGTMQTKWVNVAGKWYYFNENGEMQTKWIFVGGKWYYLDATNGDMQIGWEKVNGKWYFMNAHGAMETGWVLDNKKWYFMNAHGAMETGWILVNKKWYFMNAHGAMETGWVLVNKKWYFMDAHGAMKTGWVYVSNKWYYLYKDGKMAANTTVQGYKLGSNGAWIR